MKNFLMIGIIVAVVAIAGTGLALSGVFMISSSSSEETSSGEEMAGTDTSTGTEETPAEEDVDVTIETEVEVETAPSTFTVNMSSDGFSPKTITIKAGDTIIWTNIGTNNHWPASNIHPTHTIYPGSSIDKCTTSEKDKIFDACTGIPPGGSYSFTFNEKGNWNYHDHNFPHLTGTVVVE